MDDRLGEEVCKGLNIETIQRMSSRQPKMVKKLVSELAKDIKRHKIMLIMWKVHSLYNNQTMQNKTKIKYYFTPAGFTKWERHNQVLARMRRNGMCHLLLAAT